MPTSPALASTAGPDAVTATGPVLRAATGSGPATGPVLRAATGSGPATGPVLRAATGSGPATDGPGGEQGGPSAAGRQLAALLAAPGRYRTRWLRHVARATPGRINQAAVTRVLAEWLWLGGEASEGDVLPRALRDRVSRALGGRALSAATLRLFVAAFDMTGADEDRLWALLDGPAGVVAPAAPVAPATPAAAAPAAR
ncbi:hypothetical protein OG689_05330 [Kitasatospora sp. NBC_00240]|uniref:hypothetical protein n=1 Tax=Kitasatospora sp. NBC_00240 TaxID=2903567 RepID=UPI00224CFD50|nr:hypothetical protein [Kitasatospora sp. NBC_00240]MCX5208720.1 hypothetical protein [Kitasatospora sp. NBC_00240]